VWRDVEVLEGIESVHIRIWEQLSTPGCCRGQVSMMCDNLSNVVQQVQSGALRPIVVTALEPSKQLPDVRHHCRQDHLISSQGTGTALSLHRHPQGRDREAQQVHRGSVAEILRSQLVWKTLA